AKVTTAHGKKRKQELGQHGSSWQPDIVGCTADGKEIYFGELKGIHATKQHVNVNILRLAIFAKDALDHLHCILAEDPPLSRRFLGPPGSALRTSAKNDYRIITRFPPLAPLTIFMP
ncbi:hypothetical protein BG005_002099, partial [Podila minutissima]